MTIFFVIVYQYLYMVASAATVITERAGVKWTTSNEERVFDAEVYKLRCGPVAEI